MFASLKMMSVYVVLGFVAGVVGIPYSLLAGNIRVLYRAGIRIARLGVRAAGIRVEVSGRENVPAGVSCIFVANHVSNLDPPLIFPEIPGMASALLKQELMSIPLLGTAMRMGKFVPVERRRTQEGAKRTVAGAAEALRSGLHILIFAEGTRSSDGRLQPFKKGPFVMAEETGAPILPIAISGTQRILPKGSLTITPGAAGIEILPPLWPGDFASREELMAAVRAAIVGALPEEMRPLV